MNLNAYDNADGNINGRIWLENKKLYTKAVKFRKYYYLLKRYDTTSEHYIYYILLSDKQIEDRELVEHNTEKNRYGTVILSLFNIWDDLNIGYDKENVYVNLTKEDNDDTGEIYKLVFV